MNNPPLKKSFSNDPVEGYTKQQAGKLIVKLQGWLRLPFLGRYARSLGGDLPSQLARCPR